MTLEISNDRRRKIKSIVYSTLLHSHQLSMPVKIGTIIRSYKNIKLITYSSQIKKHGITYKELIISVETQDSYVVYNHSKNKYCIYYNDMDINIVSSNRVRWNLAHELGHVLLKHHELCSKEKLLRNDIFLDNIDDDNYKIAELEANYFAQLLLVPHVVLLGFNIKTQKHLKNICKISDKAANRRYREFVEWKSHVNAQDEYDKQIFHLYYNFIYKRKCKNCGAGLIQRYGKHCPICGEKNTLEWGDGDSMKYPLLETYEDGKLKECPVCHNEETNIEGDFCQICGTNLVNKCIYDGCSNTDSLPSNARYCPMCGYISSFLNNGLLKAWDYKEYTNNSDGFLNIPDDIDEELPFN
ncbi:MAG: ImmA/IrrE family metallo-endopeptidase [Lachnospiraceae bacterium]